MKKTVLNRVGLLLVTGMFFFSSPAYGQDAKSSRQEKKEARKKELMANFLSLDTLVTRRAFVIEADFLENQYGKRTSVAEHINFIRINSTTAIIQTGSSFNSLGDNGVGGFTSEGTITLWEVTKNTKSLSYYIRFTMSTNIDFFDVAINLSSNNNARATVSTNTMDKVIYVGSVKSLRNSSVFKGQPRY